ncbi:MAG: hypothetical protein WB441_14215 [Nocardioidaceae bacterium]
MTPDVVVVPSAPVLLPVHAGLEDPVGPLRSACADAVGWLVARHPDLLRVVTVAARPDNVARGVTEPTGVRVARHLLDHAGFAGRAEVRLVPDGQAPVASPGPGGLLVVANGSAARGEKAPGHLDPRAAGFDETIGAALRGGDPTALRDLDLELATALWAYDAPALRTLGSLAGGDGGVVDVDVGYDGDPYGVQYWVVRWS